MREPMSGDLMDKLFALGLLAVILALLFGVVGGIIATNTTVETQLDITSGAATFSNENVTDPQPQQTLGTALAFDGSGSLDGTANISVYGDWEVCTWATVHDPTQNMTILSVDGEQTLQYMGNRTTPHWVGRYWDAGEREDYDVAVAATDPENRTHLCFQQQNQNITLLENTTASPTVETNGTHTLTDARYNVSALNGSVDETRVYNQSLNASYRADLRAYPSRPLDGVAPAMRVMFDARSGPISSLPIYFTDASASVTGGQLVSGVGGDTLQAGTDYQITDPGFSNPRFHVLGGGDLVGAPVVFVTYGSHSLMLNGQFLGAWQVLQSVIVFLALGILGAAGYFAREMLNGGGLP